MKELCKEARHLLRVLGNIKSRCYNPNVRCFERYGGRDIYVCEEWMQDSMAFVTWSFVHGWQPGLEIDRRCNYGPYSPSNCRWVTRSQNARNRRSNRLLTAFNETKTIIEWSKDPRCTVSEMVLMTRKQLGWEDQKTVDTPTHGTRELFFAFGEERYLSDWARDERCRVKYQTLVKRVVRDGWTIEGAICTPPVTRNQHVRPAGTRRES